MQDCFRHLGINVEHLGRVSSVQWDCKGQGSARRYESDMKDYKMKKHDKLTIEMYNVYTVLIQSDL